MDQGRTAHVQPDNADAAAHVLTAALVDDPGFVHVLPRRSLRHDALRAFYGFAIRDALTFGRVLVERDEAGIAAVAIWYPPGAYPMSVRRKLGAIPAMARLVLRAPLRVLALERLGAAIDAGFPTQDVSYIEALGVRPDAQGHGHGQHLMHRILKESERTQVGCYLDTARPENIAFYESFGFAVVGDVAPTRRGAPAEARMLRRPCGA